VVTESKETVSIEIPMEFFNLIKKISQLSEAKDKQTITGIR